MGLGRLLKLIFYDPEIEGLKRRFINEFYRVHGVLKADSQRKMQAIRDRIKPGKEPTYINPEQGLRIYEELLLCYNQTHEFTNLLAPQR